MDRQEMLDEYKKRLVGVRQKLAEAQAAEHQLIGAIHVLETLGKQEPSPCNGELIAAGAAE